MQFAVLGWPEDGPTLRLDFRRFRYAGKFVMSNTGKAVLREPGGGDGRPGETDPDAAPAADRAAAAEAADANPSPDPGTSTGPGACEAAESDPDAGESRGTGTGPRTAAGGGIDPATFDDGVLAAAAFNEDRTDPGVLWLRYVTVRDDRRGEGLGPALAARVAARAEDRGYCRLRIAVNNPFAYHALYKAGFVYTGRETGLAELVLERPGPRDAATYQCGLDVFRQRDRSAEEAAFLADREGAEPPPLVDAAARRLDAGTVPGRRRDSGSGSGSGSGPAPGSAELADGGTPGPDPD